MREQLIYKKLLYVDLRYAINHIIVSVYRYGSYVHRTIGHTFKYGG